MRRIFTSFLAASLLAASCSPDPGDGSATNDDAATEEVPISPAPLPAVGDSTTDEPGEAMTRLPAPSDVRDTATMSEPISGRIAVVGNVPFTSVVLRREAESVALTGSLEPDLRRLAGAVVEVRGKRVEPSPPHSAALEVSGYEIVSIDGRRPHVGRLVQRADDVWLENRDSVQLIGLPRELREHIGARVWIIGEPGEDGLTVSSYGIIRPE